MTQQISENGLEILFMASVIFPLSWMLGMWLGTAFFVRGLQRPRTHCRPKLDETLVRSSVMKQAPVGQAIKHQLRSRRSDLLGFIHQSRWTALEAKQISDAQGSILELLLD